MYNRHCRTRAILLMQKFHEALIVFYSGLLVPVESRKVQDVHSREGIHLVSDFVTEDLSEGLVSEFVESDKRSFHLISLYVIIYHWKALDTIPFHLYENRLDYVSELILNHTCHFW